MGSRSRHLSIAMAGIILVVALTQVVSLMGARLEQGDVFAEYSTMRADPLGMMAVYNALDALPQYETLQYVRPFEELSTGNDTTLVIAGAGLGMDPLPILESLENFVSTGGRVVVTFSPLEEDASLELLRQSIRARDRALARRAKKMGGSSSDVAEAEPTAAQTDTDSDDTPASTDDAPNGSTEGISEDEGAKLGPPDSNEAEGANKEEETEADTELIPLSPADLKSQDISERWDFDYGFELPLAGTVASRLHDTLPVEAVQRFYTGLYFEPKKDVWTAIYARPGGKADGPLRATIMERALGEGSLVLCSDAYFLSNEAMRNDRSPELIQWVMGPNSTLLFSEVHLGNGQKDRIMTLVRRYRLHGVLAGVLLVGALFIWKNATTLLPRRERLLNEQSMVDRSQGAGMNHLLSRYVKPSALIPLCVKEWRTHFANSPAAPAVERVSQAQVAPSESGSSEADIVARYNEIAREIQHRKS